MANPAGGTGAFVTYDAATGVRPIIYGQAANVAAVVSGNNVRLSGASTLNAGTSTVNSLTLGSNLSFTNASDLLNLESGGLLTGGASTIGASANSGRLTAGGASATSGTTEFFIHGLAATTINSSIVDNPAGAKVALVLGLNGQTITLSGSNTYSGPTYVNTAVAVLSSTAGGYAVPGDLIVTAGPSASGDNLGNVAGVRWAASNQMDPTKSLTVRGAALINLNGFNQSLAGLTFINDSQGSTNIPAHVTTSLSLIHI